jgi:hypothetical protein
MFVIKNKETKIFLDSGLTGADKDYGLRPQYLGLFPLWSLLLIA